jgi:hypothetical protein
MSFWSQTTHASLRDDLYLVFGYAPDHRLTSSHPLPSTMRHIVMDHFSILVVLVLLLSASQIMPKLNQRKVSSSKAASTWGSKEAPSLLEGSYHRMPTELLIWAGSSDLTRESRLNVHL